MMHSNEEPLNIVMMHSNEVTLNTVMMKFKIQ